MYIGMTMDNLTLLTQFFGWCFTINASLLIFSTLMLILFNAPIKSIHASLFMLPKAELNINYFKYLAYYKIGILLFNLAPYISLKIIT